MAIPAMSIRGRPQDSYKTATDSIEEPTATPRFQKAYAAFHKEGGRTELCVLLRNSPVSGGYSASQILSWSLCWE